MAVADLEVYSVPVGKRLSPPSPRPSPPRIGRINRRLTASFDRNLSLGFVSAVAKRNCQIFEEELVVLVPLPAFSMSGVGNVWK
jgi:hypothetical protein